MQCHAEIGPNSSSIKIEDIPENGAIEHICIRGHRTATIIQDAKFEILAEMGINAIVNANYRDSITSFASSLERLYEFFTEATCLRQGIIRDDFQESWKMIKNMSERQVGAFVIAHLYETAQPPSLLPNKQIEFRNAVIHKGKFVNRDEAMNFGQIVFEHALPIINILRSPRFEETIQAMTLYRVRHLSRQLKEKHFKPSIMCLPSPMSLIDRGSPVDFKEIVSSRFNKQDLLKYVDYSNKQLNQLFQ